MDITHEALWLDFPGGRLRRGPAQYTPPTDAELVVRTHAVALNPVDTMNGFQRRIVYPWLTYPAVLGTDVAGEVVEVGPGVEHIGVGDRVVALAPGQDGHLNSPAHGAFQELVVVPARTTSPIPPSTTFAQAVVLPLATATASAGLFGQDQLGLQLPGQQPSGGTVVVWGASTSVGSNAVQLACHAGHRVVATASPYNHDTVRDLGADDVFDYRDRAVVARVIESLAGHHVAGLLAIGAGSLTRTVRIATATGDQGPSGRPAPVPSAHSSPATSFVRPLARTVGVQVSAIWGGTVVHDGVGEAVFTRFLPSALAASTYRPAPASEVVGEGLDAVPGAVARFRQGVRARKIVVTIEA